ncbi:MAG: THUMP domain-containing protein [Candidatus Bathyarchaeota archaeon]|nr:THUMP domain-containing protein [Candidatus Bathyarchaeota archaeon]
MPKLFFLLSGENPTLPAAEAKAILEAEGYGYSDRGMMDQILRLEADDVECVKAVQLRSAYTRVCAQELLVANATYQDILEAASKVDFSDVLKEGQSFVVRIDRIKNYADADINTMTLEVKLGGQILRQTPGAKVNLKNPDRTFLGVITDNKLILGLKLTEITSKTFSERRPRKKPFFHPSAMPSKMARCMVNLSHAKAESVLLDPFCGTGTSLIEATFIGCRAVGVDAQKRMVLGTKKNLAHFGISAEGLIWADSRKIPLKKADAIVTDPPYGRSSSTLKSTTAQLVTEVLAAASALLGAGQRICIAAPKTLNITRLGEELGFRHIESHFAYVHATLTREIAVFQKVSA